MKPTIGRIVHYWTPGFEHAAIVIAVKDDKTVDLRVFYQNGEDDVVRDAEFSAESEPHCWTWPPRV